MTNDLVPFPADWEMAKNYHGFSKCGATRDYLVVVNCRGIQKHICHCGTQLYAAQQYDRALWALLEFAPKTAKPNWPEAFSKITAEEVREHVPEALWIHEKVKRMSGLTDAQLSELRDKQLARILFPFRGSPESNDGKRFKVSRTLRSWSINRVLAVADEFPHEVYSLERLPQTEQFKQAFEDVRNACRILQEALNIVADEIDKTVTPKPTPSNDPGKVPN
jgi:hypothetical protein